MVIEKDGGGHFTEAILRPQVSISFDSDQTKALELHGKAHEFCSIANSMNFPVRTEPIVIIAEKPTSV